MHPTLARFLDVGKALELLDGPVPAGSDTDATAFVQASKEDAALTAQLRSAKGKDKPSPDAQQALVVLAVRAAVKRLAEDPALGPLARSAAEALTREGASPAEVTQMLGTVLLEEGFADEGDPDAFDGEYVRETLATLPALAALDADKVDALLDGFVESRPASERPLAMKAADTFLNEAWGEGLQPLTTEHAEVAVETLWSEGSQDDTPRLVKMISACLEHLAREGLVGPSRVKRLEAAATHMLDVLEHGEDEDDEDEDDEGGSVEPESGQPLN
jgi:hypothetical protein